MAAMRYQQGWPAVAPLAVKRAAVLEPLSIHGPTVCSAVQHWMR